MYPLTIEPVKIVKLKKKSLWKQERSKLELLEEWEIWGMFWNHDKLSLEFLFPCSGLILIVPVLTSRLETEGAPLCNKCRGNRSDRKVCEEAWMRCTDCCRIAFLSEGGMYQNWNLWQNIYLLLYLSLSLHSLTPSFSLSSSSSLSPRLPYSFHLSCSVIPSRPIFSSAALGLLPSVGNTLVVLSLRCVWE